MSIDLEKPAPLYHQVAESIRSDIASGKLKLGDQIASHQELGEQFNVSLITVKRALHELRIEGVLYSRPGMGTYVAQPTAKKTAVRSKTIGLVLKDLKSPFFSMIVHGIEEHASRKGYNLIISNSSKQVAREENLLRHLYNTGVDGLLVVSMTHKYTASGMLRKIHDEQFPYVMVSYVKDPDIYYVGTNHEQGGYLAAKHLIECGYRRIGYLNGELGNLVGDLRKKGFLRALKQARLQAKQKYMFRLRLKGEWHDYDSGYEVGKQVAKLVDKPEAMFVYNDLAALGFQQALLDKGLKVPEDVAIVGFDGIERGQYAPVPLTTVQQPFDQIGEQAVENLTKRIEGQPAKAKMILEPKLIIRESCGAVSKRKTG